MVTQHIVQKPLPRIYPKGPGLLSAPSFLFTYIFQQNYQIRRGNRNGGRFLRISCTIMYCAIRCAVCRRQMTFLLIDIIVIGRCWLHGCSLSYEFHLRAVSARLLLCGGRKTAGRWRLITLCCFTSWRSSGSDHQCSGASCPGSFAVPDFGSVFALVNIIKNVSCC